MSDKELIKQEIEKRLSSLWNLIPEGEKVLKDDFTKEDANNLGKYTELESLLKFIDSIPEEPASEDLEEAAEKYVFPEGKDKYGIEEAESNGIYFREEVAKHFKAGAEWQKQRDFPTKDITDSTMYWCGYRDCKEQMMKDAVYGYVSLCHDYPYRRSLVAIEDGLTNLKYAEKVKIIIVKTEQQ